MVVPTRPRAQPRRSPLREPLPPLPHWQQRQQQSEGEGGARPAHPGLHRLLLPRPRGSPLPTTNINNRLPRQQQGTRQQQGPT